MAMYINNNLPSLTAQRYLGQTNSKLSDSIEKLSSGLRINSASDDASGLAISEKLRGQISGLKRASLNAQDGISLLQTAEGGLQNIQNMVQRMRELAVQAGNGVYTTNDRREIQKEVEQLKSEIDRIASSTEFNTKKLLNGDATALWSSDKGNIDVTVKERVAEGNYNLNVTVDPGKNYVYKTDVMTLNEDAIGAQIVTGGGASANETNITFVDQPVGLPKTGTSYFTVTVSSGETAATVASGMSTLSYFQQSGSEFLVSDVTLSTSGSASGYVEVEALDKFSSGTSAGGDFRLRFVDAKTGEVSEWQTVSSYSSTAGAVTIRTDTAAGGDAVDSFKNNDGTSIEFSITLDASDTGTIQSGDKVLFSLSRGVETADFSSSGGGTISISDGPKNADGPTLIFTGASSLTTHDNGDSTIDYNNVSVYYAELNGDSGNLDVGNLTLNFKEQDSDHSSDAGKTTTGDFNIEVKGGGDAATSTTMLKDISRFTTDDGRNIFDNTQELTIYGNGTSATIYLEGSDTVSDLETKLTDAIVKGLGMGAVTDTSDESTEVNNNLVNYVTDADTVDNSNEAVGGTFVIQTAQLGEDSRLSFIGDQALIDGLSVATIQEGESSELTVEVTDAHTGKTVGTDTVNDFTLRDVIQGVDVEIDSDVGIDINWDNTNREVTFSASGASEDIKLHLVDNAMEMQIGANEGQTILANIPQINTKSLNIDDVLMIDQELAQESITKLDKALETVSGVRATIGAQINRLEYTMVGLETARENLTAAESRIRDLDIASEMADFTKNQILSQANVAMLSQANALPQLALQLIG
ncbi:flagellin [Limisalsivibrio acetivorans]|uniref:flagellin N-terminal helical domain-containing protein n=1 Tax=Limisalsivibrio acetivorans TaxID=1304888 RepID=UPI0003B6EC19|nr:flagellin [Limisalsivibrio acetivorans]